MVDNKYFNRIFSVLEEGMSLSKCQQCGCMKDMLEQLPRTLSLLDKENIVHLQKEIESWKTQIRHIKYSCLGCEYCFPADVSNILTKNFPESIDTQNLNCNFEVRENIWPPVSGEYISFCDGARDSCSVAVSTLGSPKLVEKIANNRPKELCIVGKTETENIGIDKIIKNTISNLSIRKIILTGQDPKGHQSGRTLYALWENGIDEKMKVIGSPGKRPFLKNVTPQEVELFRQQVQVVDMIGCEDINEIMTKIQEVSTDIAPFNNSDKEDVVLNLDVKTNTNMISTSITPIIRATDQQKIKLDKLGYFVILTQLKLNLITVEFYSYDNKLQQIIQGNNAKSIYLTIIRNNLISELTHAAYLGRELTKAELSMKYNFKYIQDGV
jgi:tetrahydromethanopterin S-methyltransferase subunit A